MKTMVLYHNECYDGFGAAWVAKEALTTRGVASPEMIAVTHQVPPPDVTGARVYMVDFCYPRKVMEAMSDTAHQITVIDHHETALNDMVLFKRDNVELVFNMACSGAGLTWDYFWSHGKHTAPRPWLINYIEDRDLWKFALPDSKAISAYIMSQPYSYEGFDEMVGKGSNGGLRDIVVIGEALLGKVDQYVDAMRRNVTYVDVLDRRVPIINAPYINISDLLHAMLDESGMSIGWSQRKDGGYGYSVRSTDDINAGAFCKRFGGGGHAKAAGFSTDFPPQPEKPGWFESMLKQKEHSILMNTEIP